MPKEGSFMLIFLEQLKQQKNKKRKLKKVVKQNCISAIQNCEL